MKKYKIKTLTALCLLSVAMTGCANNSGNLASGSSSPLLQTADKTSTNEENASITDKAEAPQNVDGKITFSDDKITAEGGNASVSGKTVTISGAGVYELSGSSSDCKIMIEAGKGKDVTLILNGVSLISSNGSVIDCESGKTLTLFLKDGTDNSLTDGAYDSADEADAAVFTRSDLIISGGGRLSVNGKSKDAVTCKDYLTINGGIIGISSADDGITGKDGITINGGELNIISNGDGIKSTNDKDADKGNIILSDGKVTIASGADGIQSEKSLTVKGGAINIISGGDAADEEISAKNEPWDFDKRGSWNQGSQNNNTSDTTSQKGLKAGGNIVIENGDITIKSADDSIHSNADVKIQSGKLALSSCDDGIHADESLTIDGGNISISKSYEGLEGKCVDINGGEISINAADDGINAAGGDNGNAFGFGEASDEYYIAIDDGNITVNAGGDGLDSNGNIQQSGGTVTVYGPVSDNNGAIDYEGSYTLSGGTLIALGSSGMAQAPSTLSQPCLWINANVDADSKIEVKCGGTVLLETTTPKAVRSLVLSCPEMESGEDCEIYANGELLTTVTASDGVAGDGQNTQGRPGGFGGNGGPGGFGGGPGGQGGFGGGPGNPGAPGGFGGNQGGIPENQAGNQVN